MTKRKYRTGDALQTIEELDAWMKAGHPVYLKLANETKFELPGWIQHMKYHNVREMLGKGMILRAVPLSQPEAGVAGLPISVNPGKSPFISDICPKCHQKLVSSFNSPTMSIIWRCGNPKCPGAWKK
jgi:hypothetical protein